MNLARRTLLQLTALTPVAAVVGCNNTPQVLTDVQLVLTGVQNFVPNLKSLLPGAVYTQVTTWLTQAQTAAAALTKSLTNASAATAFVTVVQDILNVVATLNVVPPPWGEIVDAVATLLPVVATGLSVALGGTTSSGAGRLRMMPVWQARMKLEALK